MDMFIGTKLVKATPMTRAEYNKYRDWQLPADEDGEDKGMLVEYVDGGKANHPDHEGYISWSPLDVFEKAYRTVENMDFGGAILALKMGYKVARKGWNGKGMWLILVPGTPNITPAPGTPYHKHGIESCEILPHIDMWTTNSEGRRAMLCGWLASQTDMLSTDWVIV